MKLLKIFKEAVSTVDLNKLLSQYKFSTPQEKENMLMKAVELLGKTSSLKPQDFADDLRANMSDEIPFANSPDVIPIRLKQPKQQTQQSIPSLSSLAKSAMGTPPNAPSLSTLAQAEKQRTNHSQKPPELPIWKKQNLPAPQHLQQPTDVEPPIWQQYGLPPPDQMSAPTSSTAVAAKSKPEQTPPQWTSNNSEPPVSSVPKTSMPTSKTSKQEPDVLSQLVQRKYGSTDRLKSPYAFKIGDKINMGNVSNLEVKARNGNMYTLEKDKGSYIQQYKWAPGMGLKSVKKIKK